MSSAGGKAVVDDGGRYSLRARVSPEVESIQVMAVGQGSADLSVSRRVPVPVSGFASSGTLWLAPGAGCSPAWLPTFGAHPGANNPVAAFAVFDDGDGPDLYVGGSFSLAGNQLCQGLASWDGASWSAVEGGPGFVRALLVFDDGTGEALYVAAAQTISKWDGASWTVITGGFFAALAVFDDSTGDALYAVGADVGRWDGAVWSVVGEGVNDTVWALATFDAGSGPELYAGGSFTMAGGGVASRIARWNGTSWTALGSGMNGTVRALAVFDDGSGAALHVGGDFTVARGVAANRIAKWDGASMAPLGSGLNKRVSSLSAFDDGTGLALYVGGSFTTAGGEDASLTATWDGSAWSPLGSGLDMGGPTVNAMAVFEDAHGPALYTGGGFASADGQPAYRIARWRATGWEPLGAGVAGDFPDVNAVAVLEDAGEERLYVGGNFTAVGGAFTRFIASWDGAEWAPVGGGLDSTVNALTTFDDGGGLALYAGLAVNTQGQVSKWDGTAWTVVGDMDRRVYALTVFDDGGGPELIAAGEFKSVDGAPASEIASWNGTSWRALGSGLLDHQVNALAVFDDGGGPALYAAGRFNGAGGAPASGFAKWDGVAWTPYGVGVTFWVNALAVFDDGSGPALFLGGLFEGTVAGLVDGLRRWDGASFTVLAGGLNGTPTSLFATDALEGPSLYVGGAFTLVGGMAANRVARWDGRSWFALGSGMEGTITTPAIRAMCSFDDGSGPSLVLAGGYFPDSKDTSLARWGCDTVAPALACPRSVLVGDSFGTPPGEVVTYSVTALDAVDPAPTVVCDPPSGTFFPRGTTMVSCTATDAAGNQATCEFPVTVHKADQPAGEVLGSASRSVQ